ncbi:MAG TPA: prepilin-type N-terminal cleavage/methylation domain-containing protein, partial [Lacipirellulaceae bacterium]|nr:prepilin-type N-terminal cleavage/methylation domain-containing protein [Lacipirellulaceae bacterium]
MSKYQRRGEWENGKGGDTSRRCARVSSSPRLPLSPSVQPAGFTLFELILAISLSAVLLTLIGTAISLYLVRVDTSGKRVAEAQLARTILSMIADDIHGATIYKPQDTSAIAKLMAKTATFDVDSFDKPSTGSSDSSSGTGTSGSATSSSGSSSSSNGSSNDDSSNNNVLPLGVNGDVDELYVDTTHLPKQEELFSTTTGYTNAPSPVADNGIPASAASQAAAGIVPPTDVKNVHYFVRPGDAAAAGSAGVTSLDPAAQASLGGLVRQE